MAQGKFSQPRQSKDALEETIVRRPAPSVPIEDVSDEVAAFLRETDGEEAAYRPNDQWQDQTRIVRPAAQPPQEDWRSNTRKIPENWRDATQVVPPQNRPQQSPYQRPVNPQPQQNPYQRPDQPREEWDFREPQRPVVRNHIADDLPEEDYGYEAPRSSGTRVMLISICALVLVALLGTILVVGKMFSSPKAEDDGLILSGVTAAGIDLGGMTPEEAQMALYRVADNSYPVKNMVVTMPDGTIELKPLSTGARLDVVALVDAAYNYGRKGTASEIDKAQQNAQMGRVHTIALLPYLELDTDYIRDTVEDYCDYFNSTYAPSSVKVKGDKPALKGDEFDENAPCQTILIEVGNPGRELDADDVYDRILDAYSFCEFEIRVEEASPEQLPEAIDLNNVFKEHCSTPIDAYMDMQTFEVIVETYGYTFDLEQAQADLELLEYGESMEIRLEYIVPEIKAKELEEMLFRDTLASYETKTTSDHNRNTNLKLACQAINGTLLNPGDTFSFNDVVGKRTEAAGYKEAGAFFGGESVKEVGGGICQVSSTLYACVLAADLDVVARTPHSQPVSYLPKGMDATVSWGGPEFKFRNDTDYPIRIDAEVSGGMVKIKLIGTDERDYYVKIECRESEVLEPEIQYEDFKWDNAEGYKDGDIIEKGTTGYVIKTYKIKYSKGDNSLIGETVEATSTYKSKVQVVARVEPQPTEPPTEPPTEEPTSPTQSIQERIEEILGIG